jgi:phytoene dehydrogenase-like protein
VPRFDAVVVGAGPNGLAAAVVLAAAGRAVLVREAGAEAGGAARTAALTLPGFRHDLFSAVYPLGVSSPFFNSLPLGRYGLRWVHSPASLAHPLEGDRAVVLERSVDATAAALGADEDSYRTLMRPFVARWPELVADALGPLHLPRHPLLLARFGLNAVLPAAWLARWRFRSPPARALFAGLAAHSTMPLAAAPTAAIGLMLGAAGHAAGWPVPRGGAGAITAALLAHLRALGGEVQTEAPVTTLDELGDAPLVLLDLTPRQVLALAGERLPAGYRRQLERYRYGPGTYKLDWALAGPIPWRAPGCARAATVHLGGTLEEIAAAEAAPWRGAVSPRPFVLLAQPSLFDATRAPAGRHTAWAYCHVPPGSAADMTAAVEAQVERFAPGFRDLILARHVMGPRALEARNPNLVGGDVSGGISDLRQLFFRPALRLNPYATPLPGVFLCSASTPPGGGVHGMPGFHAAQAALRATRSGLGSTG